MSTPHLPPGEHLDLVVVRKHVEADDICVFELASPDGAALPAFTAGAHLDVVVAPGVTRQYSLCNASVERHRYRIGVLREPVSRGGSTAMHDVVREGDMLRVGTPRNHFPLAVDATHSLLFAGGIGITPLLAMADTLSRGGADFTLHYCARSRERAAFHDDIATRPYARNVVFHFDDRDARQRLDATAVLSRPAPGTHVYVCGPPGFIGWIVAAARDAGWHDAQIHREYFAAVPVAEATRDTFDVQIASTGRIVTVAADQTVVAALAAHGIDVPTSCEQGVCGTCLTRVLEGIPEHRDFYLTDEEHAANAEFTPCCSRSLTPLLVLDL